MSQKKNYLGKSLIRNHKNKGGFVNKSGFRHTCDLQDGFDWARLNLKSVTEQSTLDDFVDITKLADSEFSKEFSTVQIITPEAASGMPSKDERKLIAESQEEHKHLLSIPKRPHWDASTTKEELDAKEREEFLNWRRNLALLKEKENLETTPYEKNLEIWRQLWRVIEKSHVILQIIDARNPLLFRCEDLEMYVKEIDDTKETVLLLNKADFLSKVQREMWANYFESIGVKIVFFSALQQMQKEDEELDMKNDSLESHLSEKQMSENCAEKPSCEVNTNSQTVVNSSEILSKSELINFLKDFRKTSGHDSAVTTIGLVGYPNVGKSSTINAVLKNKKVQVSATPGKTKHFQTIMIDSELCFCDCPGLVFPKFVCTKADMIINGILPVDQFTDHMSPVTLITELIPRNILEATYSILLPPPAEGKAASTHPTAEEFLNAYGYMRGFMTQRGIPDTARSARYIIKDFINGKLLYCYPPPGTDEMNYQKHSIHSEIPDVPRKVFSIVHKCSTKSEEIDKNFFKKNQSQVHFKGINRVSGCSNSNPSSSEASKPWKKHHNRNKKEKLRRIYSAVNQ